MPKATTKLSPAVHELQIPVATAKQQLPVLLVDMPAVASVTVLILANTGSRYESSRQEGLAHFFEHMVFKGSKNYPTAQNLSSTLDRIGADFNAFTGKEYTGYYVKAAGRHFELALDVLSDMLLEPALRQADIDRESGVIIEELNMYRDMPSSYVGSLFDETTFADRQLAHDIIGRKETIKAFRSADFQDFLCQYYGLENLQLVVAGGLANLEWAGKKAGQTLDKAALQQFVAAKFAKLGPERKNGKQKVPQSASLINQNAFSAQHVKFHRQKTEQAHFVLAWPAPDRHQRQRYALAVLATILGGNMSSRLFTEVREQRGLAYYVRASDDTFHDAGLLSCSAGVDPNRAAEAIKVSRAVFENLASGKKAVTAGELALAKNWLAGKLLLSLENSSNVAQFYGLRKLLSDEVISVEELLRRYQAVTLEEVQALARTLIQKGQLRFAMISNLAKTEKIVALLQ